MNIRVLFYFTLAVSSCSASIIDPNMLIKGIGKRLPQPLQSLLHLFLKGDSTVLNYDAIQLIFEELEFNDLLTVAELNKDLSLLAARAFANNFAHINIRIGNFSYSKPNRINLAIQRACKKIDDYLMGPNLNKKRVYSDSIQIHSVFYGLKTLKHFGKYIQKLELSFENADSKAGKIISKYVDDYCSDNLVELKLEFNEGDALGNFKNTFDHVEKLYFVQKSEEEMVILPTNSTFPALRSFSFKKSYRGSGAYYMNGYFPHLEHLFIIRPRYDDIDMLTDLLNANANIRSFECIMCDLYLMEYAGAKLLNVENIVLQYFFPSWFLGRRQIHFENVTKAKLYSIEVSPEITLPKLQDLEVEFNGWHFDILTNLLQQNSNLSRLHLHQYERGLTMKEEQLIMIISILPKLEEISISNPGQYYYLVGGETIIALLEEHPKLMKFKTDFCSSNDKSLLRNNLDERWHIEDYYKGLSFERKR